ncbi:MAG TPA: cbb3-type cytochrome oxidase assembly protein CcoS [Alcanivoracaceae bacterium]|nr:cbb3-type cytochrome oxidase assembly protein CcoS [Alcanivoracaceae bacterium]
MSIIVIMIPISLFMLGLGVAAFFWAANNGQFDDVTSPGLSPVSDNPPEDEPDAADKEANDNP